MKLAFVVLGLLLQLSFANPIPLDCSALEDECMSNCCTGAAGGTPETANDVTTCDGGDQDKFDTCISAVCRPGLINCEAPNSGCGMAFANCFNACRNSGETNQYCDDLCWSQVEDCVSNPPGNGGPACCGPALGLLGIAGASLALRRKS
ncbi:MAG: hypothetical protein PHV13_02730 [Candidatus ainarchaeum sp.]|nr:hypothetical protein [Candidatus ainarchaeum sp.]